MSELPIRCFSPSYKRGHEKAIVQEAFPFVKMVVHECEAAAYKENGNDILVCPDSIRGNIARVRNWILDQNKDANVVMFDDDVKFIGVWQEQKFRKLNAEEAEELIETGFNLCDEWGYKMWGINMVVDKGAYREGMPFCTVRPVLGTFCGIVPNELRYDEKFSLKEDYDYAIQHLYRYRGILRLNAYQYFALHNEQAGGCAVYRTVEKELQQFDLLQKKWGSEIVRKDWGNDKASVRGDDTLKSFDLNPKIVSPIPGV
ncbi:MAG: hypothetical protein DMF62_02360 [Acidobacteria bacterium]|nr:MAG: hypothetical protein DMF62_02360 [Acidobacteriota bacterium]